MLALRAHADKERNGDGAVGKQWDFIAGVDVFYFASAIYDRDIGYAEDFRTGGCRDAIRASGVEIVRADRPGRLKRRGADRDLRWREGADDRPGALIANRYGGRELLGEHLLSGFQFAALRTRNAFLDSSKRLHVVQPVE